jgi:hypothetical protein
LPPIPAPAPITKQTGFTFDPSSIELQISSNPGVHQPSGRESAQHSQALRDATGRLSEFRASRTGDGLFDLHGNAFRRVVLLLQGHLPPAGGVVRAAEMNLMFDDERYQSQTFMTFMMYRVKGGFRPSASKIADRQSLGAETLVAAVLRRSSPEHITVCFRTLSKTGVLLRASPIVRGSRSTGWKSKDHREKSFACCAA